MTFKTHTLDVQQLDSLPKINADLDKTVWVLINLISNAIRYSHENSLIYLGIDMREDKVVFSVRDKGSIRNTKTKYSTGIFASQDQSGRAPGLDWPYARSLSKPREVQ